MLAGRGTGVDTRLQEALPAGGRAGQDRAGRGSACQWPRLPSPHPLSKGTPWDVGRRSCHLPRVLTEAKGIPASGAAPAQPRTPRCSQQDRGVDVRSWSRGHRAELSGGVTARPGAAQASRTPFPCTCSCSEPRSELPLLCPIRPGTTATLLSTPHRSLGHWSGSYRLLLSGPKAAQEAE